jgi:HAD superfamily hydrolase (TIGR01459 family)
MPSEAAPRPRPQVLDGLETIAPHYDGFILDVWGVLHNGVTPYPGVVDALERLIAAGKRITLLSNAPMRAEIVAGRIAKIGVPRTLFHHIMTSGEEVWRSLKDRTDPFYAALGTRCLWLGPERHGAMVEGLGLDLVATPDEASFILNTGPDGLDATATAYRPQLERAAARGLPMVCANADLIVMEGAALIYCAGQLARCYEALGGTVRWHGKPHGSVYEACFRLLDLPDRARILAIGDNLETDIAGAAAAGIDSALAATGLHAGDLAWSRDSGPDLERLDVLAGAGARPTWLIPGLIWNRAGSLN